jgi:uncharacterized damage-inducible protein DinB
MSAQVAPSTKLTASGEGAWNTLLSLLDQLRDVVTPLPASVYRAQPAARVSGSIGAHMRHTLDHVASLLTVLEGGELQYDHRARGTTLEIDPRTAVNEIERLMYRLRRIGLETLERTVTFSTLVHADLPAALVHSTLAREVAFVVQHTIHHCALIALLLEWQGVRVPIGFGVAPSTSQARARAS